MGFLFKIAQWDLIVKWLPPWKTSCSISIGISEACVFMDLCPLFLQPSPVETLLSFPLPPLCPQQLQFLTRILCSPHKATCAPYFSLQGWPKIPGQEWVVGFLLLFFFFCLLLFNVRNHAGTNWCLNSFSSEFPVKVTALFTKLGLSWHPDLKQRFKWYILPLHCRQVRCIWGITVARLRKGYLLTCS